MSLLMLQAVIIFFAVIVAVAPNHYSVRTRQKFSLEKDLQTTDMKPWTSRYTIDCFCHSRPVLIANLVYQLSNT